MASSLGQVSGINRASFLNACSAKHPAHVDRMLRQRDMTTMVEPFWRTTNLADMSRPQWESLCDGCGKCCLSKLEDEDTGEIHWTSVGCRLFDSDACNCRDYKNRHDQVSDCVALTPENVGTIVWLPNTCAYRLLAEGRDLYWWHHLLSGNRETVHEAGISMRGRVTALESDIEDEQDYFDHVLEQEP